MRIQMTLGVLAAATGLGVLGFVQEGQKFPGPGSGVIKTEVVNDVQARQEGDWRVAISNVPDVRIASVPDVRVISMPPGTLAPPAFVRKGGRYEVTWANGDRQQISVVETSSGGWTRIDTGPRQRWVNLSAARAVDEIAQ